MVEAAKLLGRYLLEERLASGGMGAVYEALDERLGRRVAIKVLKEDLAGDPRFVERFRREARAVAAIGHQNIANVYDYGEDEGRHFIVMELVDGRDLARVLREEGRLSAERAARIGTQVCEALAHAHGAGVIHRDIKPANIIVTANDRAKVTDFGIARATGDSTLTATGSVIGTAQYISPEQASGGEITPATDIYSLGIVLYEMLTGTVPFTAESAIALAMKQVSEDVPPPSAVVSDLSPAFDAIVATATAKDPAQRFQDAGAMARALAEVAEPTDGNALAVAAVAGAALGGESASPAQAATPSTWPLPTGRWGPRALGRIVMVAFAVLLAIAAGLLTWRLLSAPAEQETATERRGGERQEANQGNDAAPPEPTTVTVPLVEGQNFNEAAAVLEAEGLVAVRGDSIVSQAPPDQVVDQSPGAGAEVETGTTVTLAISTGPPQEEEEDDDEGDSSGPGSGGDKGKGEDKSKGKGKGHTKEEDG